MDSCESYTVELARPPDGWTQLLALTAAARAASRQMQQEGIQVRFLRSVFVPEEDTCFFLYRAPSAELAREALRRAEAVSESSVEADPNLGGPTDSRRRRPSYLDPITDPNRKGAHAS